MHALHHEINDHTGLAMHAGTSGKEEIHPEAPKLNPLFAAPHSKVVSREFCFRLQIAPQP